MTDYSTDEYVKNLEKLVKTLTVKLNIGIIGLNEIISEGSYNHNIAEKTLGAIKDCDEKLPQESENE